MRFADILPRAYLALIYLLYSSSAADIKDKARLTNNNSSRMAPFSVSTSHCVVLLECLAFNSLSLCCLRTDSDVISYLKEFNQKNCSNISTFGIKDTAVNFTTSNVVLDWPVKNIPDRCGFLDLNASRRNRRAVIIDSNATWTDNKTIHEGGGSSKRRSLNITSIYITIIISLTSGLFFCVLCVIIFICFSQGCKRVDQVELKAGNENKQEHRTSYHSLDSSRNSDNTSLSTSIVDVHKTSAENIETPGNLYRSNCSRDFNGFSYLTSSSENCFAKPRDTSKYLLNSDNVSEVFYVKSKQNLHKTSRCLSEPCNIYDAPMKLNGQERNSHQYASLYDVHSMTEIFVYANCTKGHLPNVRSEKPSQLESVIYSEASVYSQGQESDIYSKPVVFEGSERQVFKFEGKCLNSSYVNSYNDMVHL